MHDSLFSAKRIDMIKLKMYNILLCKRKKNNIKQRASPINTRFPDKFPAARLCERELARMKIFIASDIHGSAFYCKKMLEAYHRECADKLLLLGDILYHGPRNDLPEGYNPREVCAMLNAVAGDILCVRGNCDSEVDQMVLEFPIMADYCLVCSGDLAVFATHGHVYNTSSLPPLGAVNILLHGHTHIPVCEQHENFVYMNPGSVSLPKEGSNHGYMIAENGVFEWKTLDGTVYRRYPLPDGDDQ